MVPLFGAAGVAFDYTRAAALRDKLDNALDVAVLSSLSKSQSPFVNTPTQTTVQNYFNNVVSHINGVTVTGFQATITQSVTNMAVSASYTASVPTTLVGIFGIRTVSISGASAASVKAPPYVNFYLLLDNSPSMGLGATATDISHLEALTP